ncbi:MULTISPECIES: ThiF family adenylyltransferase [Streptomyces]|uniref:ThiF family adenylyltransferase n=1 Tax=Streptomyces TaxID=1883 RepID=UPI0006B45AEF|nr:ThiF family adenylyltransferase [Streptomyces sp. NRRL S-4]KPC79853.1 thiamine biosynthesis protein ThiF [Streptomyces sp. NRRL S-4]
MHPMLKPALRRAWRGRNTVQFGVTPAHAVTLGPMDIATGSFLELLDGTRGLPLLREEARALDLSDRHVDILVSRLTEAGLLDDPDAGGPEADALRRRAETLERQRPDAAALSVVHPAPGGGLRRLAARRAMRVQVRGAGRVGAAIAAVLSGSGVGHVDVLDGGRAEPWDIAPGGLPASSVGERRDTAARQLVRRTAVGGPPRPGGGTAGTGAAPACGEPALSLIVVAPRDGLSVYAPDPDTAASWIASGTPHLYAGVIEATGVVGPLVLPGGTGCAGCLALNRAEADPQWPRMLAQWRSGRRTCVQACDLGLATAVAGLAAAHALSFLDGELPGSTGARWEAAMPLLDWRSQRLEPHLDCVCGAAGHTEVELTSAAGATQDTMAG